MLCMAHPIRVLHVIGMFNCMSTIAWSTARSPPRIRSAERDSGLTGTPVTEPRPERGGTPRGVNNFEMRITPQGTRVKATSSTYYIAPQHREVAFRL